MVRNGSTRQPYQPNSKEKCNAGGPGQGYLEAEVEYAKLKREMQHRSTCSAVLGCHIGGTFAKLKREMHLLLCSAQVYKHD